jgi:hypothetical protein
MATLTEYDGSMDDTSNFAAGNAEAQGFKIDNGKKITGFSVRGSKGNTTPCTSFTACIYAGGTNPENGTLIKKESFASSGLGNYTATPTFHDFTFTTPAIALNNGTTQYYLIISPDDGTGNDVIRWSIDATSIAYIKGERYYRTSGTWYTSLITRHNFKIYGDDFSAIRISPYKKGRLGNSRILI